MSIPHYHQQPATLDPAVEIPEDTETVPLAQGHTEERAADVAEAAVEHKDAVEAEREQREQAEANGEPEPGAVRTPDQIAKQEESDDMSTSDPSNPSESDPTTFDPTVSETGFVPGESGGSYPSEGSVDDVLNWVGSDHERAQEALARENERPTPRTTLISKLEAI